MSGLVSHTMHAGYFDNGPIQRMQHQVMSRIVKLSWAGVEVREVRLDSFKAVIHVEPCAALVAHYHDKGYAVVEEGALRIVWREPGSEASV